MHNGKKVTGVLLSPKFGLEIGVIVLSQKCAATIMREWEIDDGSIGEFHPEALEATWEQGQRQHSVFARGDPTPGGEAPKPASIRMSKSKEATDDDDMAAIWGGSSLFIVTGGGGGGGGSSGSGGGSRNSRAGSSSTAAAAEVQRKDLPADRLVAARLKELQASDRVIHQVGQAVAQFEDRAASS
jgi:hypothetical protein